VDGWVHGGVVQLKCFLFTRRCSCVVGNTRSQAHMGHPRGRAHTHTRSAYSYQYRLCPAGSELTEECFQKTPLEFDRTKQTLVWNTKKVPGADSSTPPVPADGTLRYPVPTPVFVRLSHSSGFVFVCASHLLLLLLCVPHILLLLWLCVCCT
jgi:hypothetical protein